MTSPDPAAVIIYIEAKGKLKHSLRNPEKQKTNTAFLIRGGSRLFKLLLRAKLVGVSTLLLAAVGGSGWETGLI